MARDVHVSFQGMAEYVRLCEQQQRYLERIQDVVSGSCANFGAFSGFMAPFRGTYETAHATVTESLRASSAGAGRLGDSIADTRRDFREADSGVKADLGRLRVKVEAAGGSSTPYDAGGGLIPTPVKQVNAGVDTLASTEDVAEHLPQHLADGLPARHPTLPDAGLRGLPTDGVELVAQVTDMVETGQGIGDARDDEDRYEQFEGLHRRLGGGDR